MKPEDQKLLSAVFTGSRKAAETLVRSYSDLVYKTVQYSLMGKSIPFTKDDLTDYHNTIFLNLFDNGFKKLKQFQGKNGCSLASWIRMIAVRTVLDQLRKQKKNICIDDLPEIRTDRPGTQDELELREHRRLLTRGVAQLGKKEQVFMKLHIDKGLSVSEAADMMGITPGSAYTMKHRAVEKLKTYFKKHEKRKT